jgi:Coiled-coil domain-containing protein 90-like
MAISALDTHETVENLTAAGFTDAQAEAVTRALRQVQQIDFSDLATKADLADLATKAELAELRSEMKVEFANVQREMAETKTELIKWVLGIGFAQVAAIVGLLRLLPGAHP